jgi:hypothetical protein
MKKIQINLKKGEKKPFLPTHTYKGKQQMKLEQVFFFQFSGLEILVKISKMSAKHLVKFTRQTLNFPKEFVARWWGKKKTAAPGFN